MVAVINHNACKRVPYSALQRRWVWGSLALVWDIKRLHTRHTEATQFFRILNTPNSFGQNIDLTSGLHCISEVITRSYLNALKVAGIQFRVESYICRRYFSAEKLEFSIPLRCYVLLMKMTGSDFQSSSEIWKRAEICHFSKKDGRVINESKVK